MNGSAKLLLNVYKCVHIIVSEHVCAGENRANIFVINVLKSFIYVKVHFRINIVGN